MNGVKTCTGCRREFPLEQFTKKSASRDGHGNRCKECRQVKRDGRQYLERLCRAVEGLEDVELDQVLRRGLAEIRVRKARDQNGTEHPDIRP